MESQWKKLSGTDYIFRFEAKEDGYNLLVTDLVRWLVFLKFESNNFFIINKVTIGESIIAK